MMRIRTHAVFASVLLGTLLIGPVVLPFRAEAFKEAPAIRELAKAGKIPPVDERLPPAPVIVKPIENPGLYGGTWRRAFLGNFNLAVARRILYEPLVRWGSDFKVHPNLAENWETQDSGRVWTFHLVKGVKWSDGTPFTADDILFYFDDILFRKDITPVIPKWVSPSGKLPKVEKRGRYTVRFTFDSPYNLFVEQLACPHGMELVTKPKHYLKKFHGKYANPKELAELVKRKNARSWQDLFRTVVQGVSVILLNPDVPSLCAWVATTRPSGKEFTWERNPFYWKVDDSGNQLPYIDKIVHERVSNSAEIVQRAIAGEIDMQTRQLGGPRTWKELIGKAGEGGYRLIPVVSEASVGVLMAPNLNHKDPEMRKIISDRRFRIALSHAVDRVALNKIVFGGRGTPRQAAPLKHSRFYRPSYESAHLTYDPDTAKNLLNEMGLKEGRDGWRLRRDGKTLKLKIEVLVNVQSWLDSANIVASDLRKVGIDAVVQPENRSVFRKRVRAGEHDLALWSGDGGLHCLLDPRWYFPYSQESFQAPLFGLWFQSGGREGEEPPEEIKELMDLYGKILRSPSQDDQGRLFSRIVDANERNLWVIGLVRNPPDYYVVGRDFYNLPLFDCAGWSYPNPGPIHPEQFYVAH